MLSITKIFHFEMAHAVHGYAGRCRHIHGHSYELQVTVAATEQPDTYLPAPGFIVDFKQLKQWVHAAIIDKLDHGLVLSKDFLVAHPEMSAHENLRVWEMEPTAENMLLYIQSELKAILPAAIQLTKLKLYETRDSFAEWTRSGKN